MKDKKYMQMALDLAKKRLGFTSPNPAVGTVIVKDGRVISTAFHKKAGLLHAEAIALRKAGKRAKGANLYVNLEPCAHFGKTPPCCDNIIKSGIRQVIIATKDPHPITNGKGIRKLRKAGLKVVTGLLRKEAVYLNRAFFKFITEKMPYVLVKVAQSLDGKIATRTGDSRWITSRKARGYVHKLRQEADAVLVGVKTVIKDNPSLTCRLNPKKSMTKIIIDPFLKMPTGAKVFKEAKRVMIITKKGILSPKRIALEKKAEIIEVNCSKTNRLNLTQALKKIAQHDIVSIMVEGGGETIASFFEADLVDEAFVFMAPKIIGGRLAPTSVEGDGITKIKDALYFENFETEHIGRELLLKLRCKENVYRTD